MTSHLRLEKIAQTRLTFPSWRQLTRLCFGACLFCLLFLVPWYAQATEASFDQTAFVTRFSQSFGKSVKVSVGSVERSGASDLILKDVLIAGSPLSPATSLGVVTFTGIRAEDHGGFSMKEVFIPSLRYVYEDNVITADNVFLRDISLPPNKGLYNQDIGFRYLSGQFSRLELFDSNKKRLARLENGQVRLRPSIKQNPIGFAISVPKITVYVENFPAGSTREDFLAMGYKPATGKLEMMGTYGGEQALMQLDAFRLTLNNGGVLTVALKMDGMTLDSLLTIVTLQRENGRGKLKTSKMWFGMLGQVQRYNFHNGSLRFEDRSFTGKLLKAEAKRNNTNANSLKEDWKTGLPGWLSFAKDTDFMEEAKSAMTAYLDKPTSLQISSNPMARLPVIMLAISGKLSPKQLVRQLNLSIAANQ